MGRWGPDSRRARASWPWAATAASGTSPRRERARECFGERERREGAAKRGAGSEERQEVLFFLAWVDFWVRVPTGLGFGLEGAHGFCVEIWQAGVPLVLREYPWLRLSRPGSLDVVLEKGRHPFGVPFKVRQTHLTQPEDASFTRQPVFCSSRSWPDQPTVHMTSCGALGDASI